MFRVPSCRKKAVPDHLLTNMTHAIFCHDGCDDDIVIDVVVVFSIFEQCQSKTIEVGGGNNNKGVRINTKFRKEWTMVGGIDSMRYCVAYRRC